MTPKRLIAFLLGIVAVLALAFFIRDWYVFYKCGAVESCLAESSYFQHYAKFAVTTIITVVALFVGKNCLNRRDYGLVQAGTFTALCADACFKIFHNSPYFARTGFDYTLLGICIFMVFQTIFIFRHTRVSDNDRSVPKILCIPFLVMFVFNALHLFNVFDSAFVPTVATYISFLVCSLVVACKVPKIGYFPKKNAVLVKRGMILFFFGDVFVGISLFTGPDHSLQEIIATISNNLVWYFYVPALICLVMSAYKRNP